MYKGDSGNSLYKNNDSQQKGERKKLQPWEMGIGQNTKHINELLQRRKDKLQDKPYTRLRTFLSKLDNSIQVYQKNIEALAGIEQSEDGELSFRGKDSQDKQEFLDRIPPELFKDKSTKTSFLKKYEELVAEIDILRAKSERGLGDWTGRTKKKQLRDTAQVELALHAGKLAALNDLVEKKFGGKNVTSEVAGEGIKEEKDKSALDTQDEYNKSFIGWFEQEYGFSITGMSFAEVPISYHDDEDENETIVGSSRSDTLVSDKSSRAGSKRLSEKNDLTNKDQAGKNTAPKSALEDSMQPKDSQITFGSSEIGADSQRESTYHKYPTVERTDDITKFRPSTKNRQLFEEQITEIPIVTSDEIVSQKSPDDVGQTQSQKSVHFADLQQSTPQTASMNLSKKQDTGINSESAKSGCVKSDKDQKTKINAKKLMRKSHGLLYSSGNNPNEIIQTPPPVATSSSFRRSMGNRSELPLTTSDVIEDEHLSNLSDKAFQTYRERVIKDLQIVLGKKFEQDIKNLYGLLIKPEDTVSEREYKDKSKQVLTHAQNRKKRDFIRTGQIGKLFGVLLFGSNETRLEVNNKRTRGDLEIARELDKSYLRRQFNRLSHGIAWRLDIPIGAAALAVALGCASTLTPLAYDGEFEPMAIPANIGATWGDTKILRIQFPWNLLATTALWQGTSFVTKYSTLGWNKLMERIKGQ